MKRFYLITGSGCDSGRGLFILYVPEANNLQHKLLNLTQQLSVQSTISRRVTQAHIPMKCSSPQMNSLSEMIPNTDYWFQSEPVRKAALFSPSTTAKTGSVIGPRLGSSPTLHLQSSPIRGQSVPLLYESDQRSQSSSRLSFEERVFEGRRYMNRSSQTLCSLDRPPVPSSHPSTPKANDASVPNSPVYLARPVVVDAEVNASEFEADVDSSETKQQPLYANVEQFAGVSDTDENKNVSSHTTVQRPWEKGFTALRPAHVLEDQDSDSSEELEPRRWRITSVFEPIDEKDEHMLASSSGSLMDSEIPEPSSKRTEDTEKTEQQPASIEESNHLVTSSTPGDDVPFDEAEFDSLEQAPKPALPVRTVNQRHYRRPVVANFRKCVTRSATWDGWLLGDGKTVGGRPHPAADVSIQTEAEDDSAEDGSDIVIVRTVL
ncbi:unnamed protein product [Echinostoma caproni]|uniref:Uncharacterized protein n=1 Tax=Echinostoma caproni TaxID=27848 RepID=A0A183AIN2_9TREM|nr:unnamed protein product [Echinostoma caproni]